MTYIALFLGGVLGGMLRYTLGLVIPTPDSFPLDTLVINLSGSLALGLFYGFADIHPMKPWLRTGLSTGVIGAFTTFSTFCTGVDALGSTHLVLAAAYVLASIVGGPLLAFMGDRIIFALSPRPARTTEEMSA
ncbi:fluoride efflux transporter FluC [Alicyclobacillus acidiphilus]|uniref:fluoride efflux transporter FluC n=1 Tax=Alicyclobacillus acidiphilus TaxID=182455 RepID=UPI000836C9C8|nr:CrcB family protein [Alicyclobacillus acidiphilus]